MTTTIGFMDTSLIEEIENRNTFRKAFLLSVVLASSRAFVLLIGNSDTFWWLWGGVVVIVSFVSPLSGVALALGNIMVSIGDESPWGVSVGHLAGGASSLRFLLDFLVSKVNLAGAFRKSHYFFGGIMVVILLGSFHASTPESAISALIKLVLIYILYIITYAYTTKPEYLLFLQIVIGLSAAFSALWAATSIGQVGHEFRAEGLLGTANYMAIYSGVAIPIMLSFLVGTRIRRYKKIILVLTITLPLGILSSASRGGAIVAIISILFSILIWRKIREMKGLILVLFIVAVIGLVVSEFTFKRYLGTVNAIKSGEILYNSRFQLATASLDIWKLHPLLGVGARNWLNGFNEELGRTGYGSAHVVPTLILAETGVLGLTAYFVFLYSCIKDYINVLRFQLNNVSTDTVIVQGWLVSAIAMSFAWTSGNPYNQFWFMLLLMGGVCSRNYQIGNAYNFQNTFHRNQKIHTTSKVNI